MLLKSKYKKVYLNETQEEAVNTILNKIETGEYELIDIPCICGNSVDDEFVTNNLSLNLENLELNTVICKHCGTIRITPYFNPESLVDFYTNLYRSSHGFNNIDKENLFKDSVKGSIFTGEYTYNFLKPFVEEYKIKHNKTKLKIFEIGCGYGGNLYHFHNNGEDVYGCDYGQEGIEIAKSKGMNNMFVGDMFKLKDYGIPDIVIINHVLEHIVDLKSFFDNLKKLINEDTLVYIGVPGISSIGFRSWGRLYEFFQIGHTWCFSSNTLQLVLNKNSFKKIEGNEIIQSLYKLDYSQEEKLLLSEYQANRSILQGFDGLYNMIQQKDDEINNIKQKTNENSELILLKQSELQFIKKYKKNRRYKKILMVLSSLLFIISVFLVFK